jgi:hypothetical protein
LLQYIVAHSQHPGELGEQQIGIRVFGRPETYNRADDNIVRASARQLRVKLKEYFETEGREEPLIVEIPKGTYVPVFVARPAKPEENPPEASTAHNLFLGAVLVAALVACTWLGWDNWQLRKRATAAAAPDPVSEILFKSGSRLNLVVADGALLAYQRALGHVFSLEDYTGENYLSARSGLPKQTSAFFSGFLRTRTSSLADVVIVAKVAESAGRHHSRVRVRHAREVLSRDFQADNFIIIGGVRANPWAGLFESGLNFRFQINPKDGRGEIVNLKPRPGELPLYTNRLGVGRSGTVYARVALVPNLAHNGSVLLIAGVTAPGTEAAGDFMVDPNSLPILERALHVSNLVDESQFEVVLEASVLEGAPRQIRLIAVR